MATERYTWVLKPMLSLAARRQFEQSSETPRYARRYATCHLQTSWPSTQTKPSSRLQPLVRIQVGMFAARGVAFVAKTGNEAPPKRTNHRLLCPACSTASYSRAISTVLLLFPRPNLDCLFPTLV